MPKATVRPSLATSSSDFALPSSPLASSSSLTLDDPSFLLSRFRRPSLLSQKTALFGEGRLHSPLTASFTPYTHSRRRSRNASFSLTEDPYDSDRERMATDSPTSGTNTPPMKASDSGEDELIPAKPIPSTARAPPLTPPRRKSSTNMDELESYGITTTSGKRVTLPLKKLRIQGLLAESRPDEAEVKSEAAFQRLITSCSDLPLQPRTPRPSDRGRYPEEAGHEDNQREDTPSDDDENDETEEPFAFSAPGGTDPINIRKPVTPAGSIYGDGMAMCSSELSDSGAMEIDAWPLLGSPSMSMMSTPINQWRSTPPPTATSAMRSNKLDDRFDPYPSSSKRRAVSPAVLESNQRTPIGRGSSSRLPIAVPINIPGSQVNSACSSPTISGSYPRFPPSVSAMSSSPTIRSTMALASPILRPIIRRREGEEKDVEGAGEAVNGLTLG
ncbi:hypothetical protein AGABI2DRAFT_113795 [Agaricus bisporus var. bisporus H97]|uniref:hypothetical protein n=1 Tax=Agaricus bisporus var. bisporus (strain H97 / ATCC MYA-4626 / FGSC 10389) TaxID=936046 RepID=UPI00029F6602|nr:hypothetical protein AGABI2DRAFT_113795 [Agaricus bisporus var. bisporus H97]EKV51050.1 hypothetical protein AGABI2DRAFT_113795 [Agaricus bisporus var. bisporus H97]